MISSVLKPRHVSDFVVNYLRNCQESEGRETKRYDFWTIFFILNFLKLSEI